MVYRNKRLDACISNVDLCSCLARATTRPHKDIIKVRPPLDLIETSQMFVKKDTKVTDHHQLWKTSTKKQIKLPFCYKDLLVEGRNLSPFRPLATSHCINLSKHPFHHIDLNVDHLLQT
jgi:hypothetical protein